MMMMMMMINTSLLLCSTLTLGAHAFTLPSSVGVTPGQALSTITTTALFMAGQQQQQQQQEGQGEQRVAEGTHEELMYALGVNLARQLGDVRPLVRSGEELAEVAKGLLDAVVGRLPDEGQQVLLSRRGKELNDLIATRANEIRVELENAGREMLNEMASKPEVQTLPSGVLLHVLEYGPEGQGAGERPTKASTVKVHYHGTLADGTVFDSTLGDEPVTFPLNAVVPGWREGVLKMHQGETAMIGIPPEQGYGPEGTPDGRIPGGSSLFFKIQLLEILSAGVGGSPLLGADGQKIQRGGGGLLGADGAPLS